MSSDLVVYQFSRSKVEGCDFAHFLRLYAPEKLPTGRRLRDMMNSMTFMIEGYDDDTRDLHWIPEVRQFYSTFREAWPYWLYFCNLDTESLHMMVVCSLPVMTTLKIDHKPGVMVEYTIPELLKFLNDNLAPMNALCARGGMFDRSIEERINAILSYFKLPINTLFPG